MTEDRLKKIEARFQATEEGIIHWDGEPDAVAAGFQMVSQDIPDLVAALREAQELLRGLADDCTTDDGNCELCGRYVLKFGHKANCSLMLAKQYLEEKK